MIGGCGGLYKLDCKLIFVVDRLTRLPFAALAKIRDVSRVMATVPSVERNHLLQRLAAVFRMHIALFEVRVCKRIEQNHPTSMQTVNHLERQGERCGLSVRKLRPLGLVIGIDRRPLFRQRMTDTRVRVEMTVGDVVNHLTNGPAALAVRCFKLFVTQAGDRATKFRGQRLNVSDGRRALRRGGCGALEFTNRIAERIEDFSAHGEKVAWRIPHSRAFRNRIDGRVAYIQ
jgi:hypothetical protein